METDGHNDGPSATAALSDAPWKAKEWTIAMAQACTVCSSQQAVSTKHCRVCHTDFARSHTLGSKLCSQALLDNYYKVRETLLEQEPIIPTSSTPEQPSSSLPTTTTTRALHLGMTNPMPATNIISYQDYLARQQNQPPRSFQDNEHNFWDDLSIDDDPLAAFDAPHSTAVRTTRVGPSFSRSPQLPPVF